MKYNVICLICDHYVTKQHNCPPPKKNIFLFILFSRIMYTCPKCLKQFRSLSKHFYRSSCITIKVKPVPKKKVVNSKYKKRSNHILTNKMNISLNHPLNNNDNDERNQINICDRDVLVDDYENMPSHFLKEIQPDRNEYSSTNEMIQLYEKLKHNKSQKYDPNYYVWIELLKILEEINAPLNAFDKIMNWATKSKTNGYQFTNLHPTRKSLMKELNEMLCANSLKPIQKVVTLSDNTTELVTTFDFEKMCFSLLTDENIMKDENFTFVNDDPRDFKRSDKQSTTCIEDGFLFQSTANLICKDKKDFCLGIKLFIDATHTDVHSNWVLDPVMFTFTFLTNNTTRQHNAWRPIGFINNQGKRNTTKSLHISPKDKLQDFHTQLDIIFESVRKIQQKGGFEWNFQYKNVTYPTRMFPVIILIVGDAQGNHKLCGMYNSFYGTSRVNHSCDCPWISTDDENMECNFISHQYIKMLCETNNEDELKSMSQHNIVNAFDNIVIGNHPAGLNALMPAEILHQMFLGVVEYTLSGFLQLYSKKGLCRLDNFARAIYPISIHNSDRSIPNLSSQYGYTSLTRQKGSDRIGICLTVLLCLSSDIAEHIGTGCKKSPSDKIRLMYRNLFQNILLYIEWLSQATYNKESLQKYVIKIKVLMRQMRLLVHRENNKGLKVGKFHEMLHVVRDIELFGPPCGYDGRPGESSHKDTKRCAVKTQRRKSVFEFQTGFRIYESLLISNASSVFMPQKKTTKKFIDSKSMQDLSQLTMASHYSIHKDNEGNIVQNLLDSNHEGTTYQKNSRKFHQDISEYISMFLSKNNVDGIINCRTFITLGDDLLIRCTPSYNSTNVCWYDWVWINWEYDNGFTTVVPAQIYSIVDLRCIGEDQSTLKPGFYVCIRSISKVPTPKWKNSKIIFSGMFETDKAGKNFFRLIHVENIVKKCYAIPDFDNFEYSVWKTKKWLFVCPKEKWADLF